jgi:hypothetical protein
LAFLLLIGGFGLVARQILPPVRAAGPVLASFQPKIDVGTVSGGTVVTRTFNVYDRSSVPATILSIDSDCGCTIPSWSRRTLHPGEHYEIPVTFYPQPNAGDEATHFDRTILAKANTAFGEQILPLHLTGMIAPDISIRAIPSSVNLGPVGSEPRLVVLHFLGDASSLSALPSDIDLLPGENRSFVVPMPAFDASRAGRSAFKDCNLRVHLRGTSIPGKWRSQVRFAPDHDSVGLVIPIEGSTEPRVYTATPVVLLQSGATRESRSTRVSFQSLDGGPIRALRFSTTMPVEMIGGNPITQSPKSNIVLELSSENASPVTLAGDAVVTFGIGKEIVPVAIKLVILCPQGAIH